MAIILRDLEARTSRAVAHYWTTLAEQSAKQKTGDADRGGRAGATGGKQMDGFCELVNQVLIDNGMPAVHIFANKNLELPGYFRPTKRWDMVVVYRGQLVAALEFKSQAGPSFGNNFNNRSEEAIGTAQDLWTAFREGAFVTSQRPFLGWVMLLEDCPKSRAPVRVDEPHFPVFPEFHDSSYGKRYELLLRRLVREQLYDAAAFLMATPDGGPRGVYTQPAADLTMRQLLAGLAGRVAAIIAGQ
ncbi:MAG: PaeR7I family type II restriction endonuclease [Myxococcota bacterium]